MAPLLFMFQTVSARNMCVCTSMHFFPALVNTKFMKGHVQMRLNWKSLDQYPSAQSVLISNTRMQGNKSSLSVTYFFQMMLVKSKIKDAGASFFSGGRRPFCIKFYYSLLLLWYTKKILLPPYQVLLSHLASQHPITSFWCNSSDDILSMGQHGRNKKWNSVRDFEQHEYIGNVPLVLFLNLSDYRNGLQKSFVLLFLSFAQQFTVQSSVPRYFYSYCSFKC